MLGIKSITNRSLFVFLWTLATFLGWMLIIYPGLAMRDEIISSWGTLPSLAWDFLVEALILGFVVGVFHYGILFFAVKLSGWWVLLSTASYAIANPIALILSVSLIAFIAPETMTSGGNSFISMPLAFTMLFTGAIVGAIQILAFRGLPSLRNWRKILLWVLGSSLAWSLGFVATSYTWTPNTPLFVQSGSAGLVIGIITGLLILMMLKD